MYPYVYFHLYMFIYIYVYVFFIYRCLFFAGNGGGGVRNKPDVRTLHVACLLMARDETPVSPLYACLLAALDARFGCARCPASRRRQRSCTAYRAGRSANLSTTARGCRQLRRRMKTRERECLPVACWAWKRGVSSPGGQTAPRGSVENSKHTRK